MQPAVLNGFRKYGSLVPAEEVPDQVVGRDGSRAQYPFSPLYSWPSMPALTIL